MPSISHLVLVCIIFLQWIILTFLSREQEPTRASIEQQLLHSPLHEHPTLQKAKSSGDGVDSTDLGGSDSKTMARAEASSPTEWTGVAATLAVRLLSFVFLIIMPHCRPVLIIYIHATLHTL